MVHIPGHSKRVGLPSHTGGRSDVYTRWVRRVGQHAAHTAHGDLTRVAIAANTGLVVSVHPAVSFEALVRVMARQPDVAILAPVRAPRVADQEILAVFGIGAVPKHQNRMVHGCVDAAAVEHSPLVEGPGSCVDRGHQRPLRRQRSEYRVELVHGQPHVAPDPGAWAHGRCGRPTGGAGRGVVARAAQAVPGNVLEGELCRGAGAATGAATVPRVGHAVDELLVCLQLHAPARDLRVHLQSACRRHRPAGATPALIPQEVWRGRAVDVPAPVLLADAMENMAAATP
mmetsp:Transcript_105760/g.329652  ORF Transcript_105760/g.329652 Transcript_105760/m.329652 type:complete len:286 (-) Transcript_105760:86-943(-)